MNEIYDPNKYEVEYVAGDAAPLPLETNNGGWNTSFKVGLFAHPKIRYGDKLLEGDLYKVPDGTMTLHIICPKCLHGLKIDSNNKQIDWDEERQLISVEKFRCRWELDTNVEVGVFTHTNLCKWTVGIYKGIARDA